MNYEQVQVIREYLKSNEKNQDSYKVGVEFEYFIVDKNTLKAIPFEGKEGVQSTLMDLLDEGYKGIYDDCTLVGLIKGESTVTLEPGSQIEISVRAKNGLICLENEYKKICHDIISVIEPKNQVLLATGYQVQSRIDEINIIPKKRYHFMYDYFQHCGVYAHHMMKQTASLQVCIDYENENDYHKKYRILNTLSPVFYVFFDNSPFFEGERYHKHSVRSKIWDNCDNTRCGIIKEALTDDFNYTSYAKYILNQSIIFKGEEFTNQSLFKDLFTKYKIEDLEHAFSMVFPDVRTRKFIEIRMIDSLPYPLNFSVVAFLKGMLYNEQNVDDLYQFVLGIHQDEVIKVKRKICDYGIDVSLKGYSIYEIVKYLIALAYKGLKEEERKYLMPIMKLIQLKQTPKEITKERLSLGKRKALEWCILQKPLFWEDSKWIQAV